MTYQNDLTLPNEFMERIASESCVGMAVAVSSHGKDPFPQGGLRQVFNPLLSLHVLLASE
jgi:hypothetical protein